MFYSILAVGAGSFAGGALRYVVSCALRGSGAGAFPAGTFAVNIAGCLLIGLLYGVFERGGIMNAHLRLFLTVGFCGGFTTFSTFVNESYALMRGGDFLMPAIYAAASLAAGLVMLHLGHLAVRMI